MKPTITKSLRNAAGNNYNKALLLDLSPFIQSSRNAAGNNINKALLMDLSPYIQSSCNAAGIIYQGSTPGSDSVHSGSLLLHYLGTNFYSIPASEAHP